MEFETKQAGTLKLQPVNQQALLDIMSDLKGVIQLAGEDVEQLQGSDTSEALVASNRLLTYCFGWGVQNDPPKNALETLAILNKPTHLPNIARANWLRYLVLDDDEAQDLMVAVIALTFPEA